MSCSCLQQADMALIITVADSRAAAQRVSEHLTASTSVPPEPLSYGASTPVNVARGDRHGAQNTWSCIHNILAMEPDLPKAGATRQLERACNHFYENARIRKFLLFTLSVEYRGAAVRDYLHLTASEHEHFMRLGTYFLSIYRA